MIGITRDTVFACSGDTVVRFLRGSLDVTTGRTARVKRLPLDPEAVGIGAVS